MKLHHSFWQNANDTKSEYNVFSSPVLVTGLSLAVPTPFHPNNRGVKKNRGYVVVPQPSRMFLFSWMGKEGLFQTVNQTGITIGISLVFCLGGS